MKKNKSDLIGEQKLLVDKMSKSYTIAKNYNDSVFNCNQFDTLLTSYYDSCFHSNDATFNNCHNSLMNISMMNNSSIMMGNNSTNCNTQNNDVNQLLNNMNSLRQEHNLYHNK